MTMDLEKQYERYIAQIREEVSQLFWLHNFFFAINAALVVSIFLRSFPLHLLLVTKVVGILLTFYWYSVVNDKNRWRKDWLERIRNVEKKLGIEEDFQMWPKDKSWKGGLSDKLFFWPIIAFATVWLLLVVAPECLF